MSIRVAQTGELVDPNGNSLLCTIMDDAVVYANYTIDEAYVLQVRARNENRRPGEGGRADIQVDMGLGSGDDFPFHGKVYRGDNTFDPQSGTITIEAIFDNPDGHIIPGMYCRVRAIFGEAEATLVPDVAIAGDQAGRYVLVVNDKDVVERRNVTPGSRVERLRRIEGGDLRPGERVVVNGVQRVRPGVRAARPSRRRVRRRRERVRGDPALDRARRSRRPGLRRRPRPGVAARP
jgi:multidrug efflux system membrane fusion protein